MLGVLVNVCLFFVADACNLGVMIPDASRVDYLPAEIPADK